MPARISLNTTVNCVRVCEGGHHPKQTYFTLKQYGSLERAYQAAIDYESQLPPEQRQGRIKPHKKAFDRSQSKILGVSPVLNRSGFHAAWRASWTQESSGGGRCNKSKDFYFSTHGSQALNKAVECRREMVLKHMSP